MADGGHHTTCRRHLQQHHDQHQQHGRERPVDDDQHHSDHGDRDEGDLDHALVAGFVHVRGERTLAGDIGFHARRWVRVIDDLAHRGHRFVGQRLALIAREVDLNVSGLAVGALGTGRGDQVAPVVLHVLNVFGVGLQCADQLVVIVMGFGAEWLVTLQHDHRDRVGVELIETLADLLHRHECRCVLR